MSVLHRSPGKMILETSLLLVLSVAWEVSGASFSKVFMQTGPESAPAVEYVQYGAPLNFENPHIARLTGTPYGSVFPLASEYGTPFPFTQEQAVAPIAPSANIVTYKSSVPNLPLIYSPTVNESPGYEYVYVTYDQFAGDHKLHNELSDGSAVRGEYSFLQPDGLIRGVKYLADDTQGFNTFVQNFLPVEETKHTAHYALPCHDIKSEPLIEAHNSHASQHHESYTENSSEEEHHESHEKHHESQEEEEEHEHEERHASHEEHHAGHDEHHAAHDEHHAEHEGHHGDHEEHHESHEEHHEEHKEHHEDHEGAHHEGEHHGGHEEHHEGHEQHHGEHEERHAGHEESSESEETEAESREAHSESHHEHHEEHEASEEHEGHGHNHHHEEVEHEPEREIIVIHEGNTHEHIIEEPHIVHEHHSEVVEHEHVVGHHGEGHHESHQAMTVELQPEHAVIESNVFVPYDDVIKCIQAAMKLNSNPVVHRPASPLTYLVFNKPC